MAFKWVDNGIELWVDDCRWVLQIREWLWFESGDTTYLLRIGETIGPSPSFMKGEAWILDYVRIVQWWGIWVVQLVRR